MTTSVPARIASIAQSMASPPDAQALDRLAERLSRARRPLLWVGGGTRAARAAVKRLADLGFGVVSSVQGRGVLPEDHPMSLGAHHMSAPAEQFYATCDAMLVVGSKLRSNETEDADASNSSSHSLLWTCSKSRTCSSRPCRLRARLEA